MYPSIEDLQRLKYLSADERKQILENDSDSSLEEVYPKPLTEEEITEQKTIHAAADIEIEELELELKNIKAEYKAKIKKLHEKSDASLACVKAESIWTIDVLYKFINRVNGTVTVVDRTGHIIETREIRDDERQYFIKMNRLAV